MLGLLKHILIDLVKANRAVFQGSEDGFSKRLITYPKARVQKAGVTETEWFKTVVLITKFQAAFFPCKSTSFSRSGFMIQVFLFEYIQDSRPDTCFPRTLPPFYGHNMSTKKKSITFHLFSHDRHSQLTIVLPDF